jgi:hypothetical protein
LSIRGYSAIEVAVVSVVLMALLTSAGLSLFRLIDWHNRIKTEKNLESLVKALEVYYTKNREITFAKIKGEYEAISTSLSTWDSSGSVFSRMITQSFYCGRSLTPVVQGLTIDSYSTSRGYSGYGTVITVFDIKSSEKNALSFREDLPVIQYFLEAGCEVTDTQILDNPSYNYIGHVLKFHLRCEDRWGKDLRFYTEVYTDRPSVNSYNNCSIDSSGTIIKDFDPQLPIRYEIRSAGKDRRFYTSDDLYVRWDTSGLDSELIEKSTEKIQKVADLLNRIHQRIGILELNRSSTVSLQGYDDVRIPWVWRIYSIRNKSPSTLYTELCNITDTSTCRPSLSCVCENAGWWYTGGSTESGITAVVFFNLIKAGLLNVEDMYDAFGMPIAINLLGAAGGSWYPPKPSDSYILSPPYVSTVKTTWGKELKITHGQP